MAKMCVNHLMKCTSYSKTDSKLKEKISCKYSSEQGKANLAHSKSGIQSFKTKVLFYCLLYCIYQKIYFCQWTWTILKKKKLQLVLLTKPSPEPYSTLSDTMGNQWHIFRDCLIQWCSNVQQGIQTNGNWCLSSAKHVVYIKSFNFPSNLQWQVCIFSFCRWGECRSEKLPASLAPGPTARKFQAQAQPWVCLIPKPVLFASLPPFHNLVFCCTVISEESHRNSKVIGPHMGSAVFVKNHPKSAAMFSSKSHTKADEPRQSGLFLRRSSAMSQQSQLTGDCAQG